jgi:hypothetical protein
MPGRDNFIRRECQTPHLWQLKRYFLDNQESFWDFVTTFEGDKRPRIIHLVTGQILTNEYHITHQQNSMSGCTISVKSAPSVPIKLKKGEYFMCSNDNLRATSGFEVYSAGSDKLYSIFFETDVSSPINRFSFKYPKSNLRSGSVKRIYEYFRFL